PTEWSADRGAVQLPHLGLGILDRPPRPRGGGSRPRPVPPRRLLSRPLLRLGGSTLPCAYLSNCLRMTTSTTHLGEDVVNTGFRVAVAVLAGVFALSAAPSAGAKEAPPPAGTVCTWGGTAAQPTGTFTITPGLTN